MIKQGSSKTCANCTAYFGMCHCVPVSLNEQSANSCRFWGEKNMGRYFFQTTLMWVSSCMGTSRRICRSWLFIFVSTETSVRNIVLEVKKLFVTAQKWHRNDASYPVALQYIANEAWGEGVRATGNEDGQGKQKEEVYRGQGRAYCMTYCSWVNGWLVLQ